MTKEIIDDRMQALQAYECVFGEVVAIPELVEFFGLNHADTMVGMRFADPEAYDEGRFALVGEVGMMEVRVSPNVAFERNGDGGWIRWRLREGGQDVCQTGDEGRDLVGMAGVLSQIVNERFNGREAMLVVAEKNEVVLRKDEVEMRMSLDEGEMIAGIAKLVKLDGE